MNLAKYINNALITFFFSYFKNMFSFLESFFVLFTNNEKQKNSDADATDLASRQGLYIYLLFKNLLNAQQHIKFLDLIFIYFSFSFNTAKLFFNSDSRLKIRLKQTDVGFFLKLQESHNKHRTPLTFSYYLLGFQSMWRGLRFWVLSLVIGLTAFYVLMVFRFVPLLKISFQWLCIVMFLYWLMSGFVFFIKKYQTSKFTTVIQRFWRRTYILFWLIETGVFATFLYLTFNASQEPFYMHDQIKVFKTHLFSWRLLLLKIIGVAVLIAFSYCLLLYLKWNVYTKQSILFFLVTLFLTYIVWLEFYQFFHVISYYGGLFWTFDTDERCWVLENEFKRTRLVNNYVAFCLMAKFWHLIFIYVFWVFFILRTNELQRYRYPLLSANLQNFIILYIMCWLFMYPWIKLYARKSMDYTYFWFFTNAREIGVRVFFTDLKLFFFSFANCLNNEFTYFYKFFSLNYYYWIDSSYYTKFDGFRKHYIKNNFLNAYYSSTF